MKFSKVEKAFLHRTNSYFIPKHFLLHFKSIPIFSILNTLPLLWQNIDWNRKPCTFATHLSSGFRTLSGKKLKLSAVCWLGFTALLIIDWSLTVSSLYLSQYLTTLSQTSAVSHCLSSTLRWYQCHWANYRAMTNQR